MLRNAIIESSNRRSPTLMGSDVEPNIADAAWQGKVVQTILENTFQIFDAD